MKRSTALGLLTTAIVAFPRTRLGAQQLTTIRFGTTQNETYALGIFTQEGGFFRRHGFDVDMNYFTGGGAIIAAVVGGSLDFACVNWGAISNAHLNGVPVRVVAPGGVYTSEAPTTVLITAKNATFRTAKDLNGKTISVTSLRDLQQAAVMKWMDANGGDSSSVRFLELPLPSLVAALDANRVDAGMMAEPNLTLVKNEVRLFAKPYDALAKRLMITAHVTMANQIAERAPIVRQFAAALAEGAAWANANHGQTAGILSRIAKMPLEVVSAMSRADYAQRLEIAAIQPAIDASVEYKFLRSAYSVRDVFWTGART
jgi:NitT/TauT family transport system substrate-binding protein